MEEVGFPMPAPMDVEQQRRKHRRQIAMALVVGALSAGATVMSCVGQSFSLRQARALEAIEHRLEVLTPQRCP